MKAITDKTPNGDKRVVAKKLPEKVIEKKKKKRLRTQEAIEEGKRRSEGTECVKDLCYSILSHLSQRALNPKLNNSPCFGYSERARVDSERC